MSEIEHTASYSCHRISNESIPETQKHVFCSRQMMREAPKITFGRSSLPAKKMIFFQKVEDFSLINELFLNLIENTMKLGRSKKSLVDFSLRSDSKYRGAIAPVATVKVEAWYYPTFLLFVPLQSRTKSILYSQITSLAFLSKELTTPVQPTVDICIRQSYCYALL